MTKKISALLCVACACVVAPAAAQPYPARIIRIIVPFVAGGPTDINARMVGQRLTEAWGQSVVVDNRPAAGGTLGTELVVRAAPDGYTLLGANPGPLTIAPTLNPKLPYDTFKDLAPVILVTNTTSVIAAHPNVPAKNIPDLLKIARASPGKLTYGSPGVGTVGHLTMELLGSMGGVKLLHVPYKGTAQANNDFLAGQIDLRTMSIPVALPLMKAGKLKVLGVNSRQRSVLLPEAPTVDESGLKGFEAANWNGIMAPAGTPREIVMRLHDEIQKRVLSASERERLQREGYDIAGLGPEAFTAFMVAETAKWAKVIRAAGVKSE